MSGAGSRCLNRAMRSQEVAALDIARRALREIAAGRPTGGPVEQWLHCRTIAVKAQCDIDTIMSTAPAARGDIGDGHGDVRDVTIEEEIRCPTRR